MPEDRPTPPPQLVDQSRDPDLRPYERAAAQAELDTWYQLTYREPEAAGAPPPPPPAAPASSRMLGDAPPPSPSPPAPPSGGTRDAYTPPAYIADQAVPAELRGELAQAAASLAMPRADIVGLEQRYEALATDTGDAPPPEQVQASLDRWHGPQRSREIVAAAQAATEEAIAKWPGLAPMLGVLGTDAHSISLIGLARLKAKE